MRVAFRVDASQKTGIGHFMRCLTLADALKQCGAHVRFISRQLPDHLRDVLGKRGHEFTALINEDSAKEKLVDGLQHSDWLGTSQAADARETATVLSGQRWDWLI